MSEAHGLIVVTSEAEAAMLLEKALSGEVQDDTPALVSFKGWPILEIKLPGTPISGSISPTMMEAFIELQTSLYRANSLISYDIWDLRGLTRTEKDRLEFRVKVTEGSSNYSVALAKPIEVIGTNIISKMTPADVLISVLATALMVAGTIALRSWLSYRIDIRKAEASKEETKLFLDAQKQIMDHDEKMAEILKHAMDKQPVLQDVETAIEPAKQQMLRALNDENGGTIQGIAVSRALASELIMQKRQQAEVVRFSGLYKVTRVDTSLVDGFRVTLTDVDTGAEVSAALQDAVSSETHRERIRDAEWSKQPVRVDLKARQLRGRYVDAVVQGVVSVAPYGDKGAAATP